MAQLTIRLIVDPATGKKDVVISYRSDSDALPSEHEEEHRALVDGLIEGGALAASELGRIVIERDGDRGAPQPQGESEPRAEPLASER